jgi:hypothetical protein
MLPLIPFVLVPNAANQLPTDAACASVTLIYNSVVAAKVAPFKLILPVVGAPAAAL